MVIKSKKLARKTKRLLKKRRRKRKNNLPLRSLRKMKL